MKDNFTKSKKTELNTASISTLRFIYRALEIAKSKSRDMPTSFTRS